MKNVILFGFIIVGLFAGFMFVGQVSAQYDSPTSMPAMPNQPSEVSGKYSNPEFGVDVTLPNRWSGMEMKLPGGSAIVTAMPGGMQSASEKAPTTMMSLAMTTKNTTKTPPSAIPDNIPKDEKCNQISTSTKKINNVSFIESIIECTGVTSVKMKTDVAQTDKYYISMSYIATPSSNYDTDVANFDSALGTIQVANAIESAAIPQSTSETPSTAQSASESPAIPEFPITLVSIFSAMMMGIAIVVAKRLQFLKF